MINLAFKGLIVALGCTSIVLLLISSGQQFIGGLAFSCTALYYILRVVSLFFDDVESKRPAAVIINHFFSIFDDSLHYSSVAVAVVLFYLHGQPYELALVFWLCLFTLIRSSVKVTMLSSFIPAELYISDSKVLAQGETRFQQSSKRFFTASHWPAFLLYTYLFSSNAAFLLLGLCVVLSVPYLVIVFKEGCRLVSHALGHKKRKIEAYVAEYNPEVIFYCTGAKGSVYQLNQWIPVLEKCEKRVLVLVREQHYLTGILKTSLPIGHARAMGAIDSFLSSSSRVVLYPANAAKNVNMMRWSELTHVFVNHGESDKFVNVSKFLRCYDKLYVAGQMAIDRVGEAGLAIPESSFALVGRPQTDISLSIVDSEVNKEALTVLYAPTWEGFSEGANYTSVSDATYLAFSQLLKKSNIKVVFKPHPYTGMINPSVARALKRLHSLFEGAGNAEVYGADKNIHELMNESGMMITDVSSVLNDYLYTEKPIIITNPHGLSDSRYHEMFFSSRGAYILDQNLSSLGEFVAQIRTEDLLKEERLNAKEYSLGCWPQGALKRFNEQLAEDWRLCVR